MSSATAERSVTNDPPVADPSSTEAGRTWLRIAACCLLLTGLAFIQTPGFQLADTKFDLVVDPSGFLGRATHLWDGQGAFGQLQNQAYGYLWPMGPFFALFDLLNLEPWAIQRLWHAVVLGTAFVGAARVSRALGVRTDFACLAAGFAYALSPRMLSLLGSISIEVWPSAVAPWVLLPLIHGAQRGSPRRAALLAGLAVATVGGVNAAATFAVIPVGAIWVLTRTPGPRRRSLMIWWPTFTLLGTLWWLVPLFLMGAYSPPFLDYIETASVTTFPTTIFDALRGSSAWVPYIDQTWRGGAEMVRQFWLPLNSGIVLMLGLIGLFLRGNPHRQFLLVSLFAGLSLVTLGHVGAVEGWFAQSANDLLDGALAPIRNVHKFDPLIRLPMVLGLAWFLELTIRAGTHTPVTLNKVTLRWPSHAPLLALATLGMIGAITPALTGHLAPLKATYETPGYWQEAVSWLDEQTEDSADGTARGGVALLAPGSGFAQYLWGTPRDEPVQYLDANRWAVRNAIPLTPPGNIRMLDAVETRLAQGRPSPGLADYLRRAGVGLVVVRNDLAPSTDVPDGSLVHAALVDSPGIKLVKSFGPLLGGDANLQTELGRLVVNGGWQEQWSAIEVFAVAGGGAAASASDALPLVVGGPEDLLDLADLGLLSDQPTQLAADVPAGQEPHGPVILTDGYTARERFFGKVHDASSSVLAPGDVPRSGNPTRDYLLPGGDRWATTAEYLGVAKLSASSSLSDAVTLGFSRPGNLPFAAVDGDPATTWLSGNAVEGPPWWRADFTEPRSLTEIEISLGARAPSAERLVVRTQSGLSEPVEFEPGDTRTVTLDGDPTSWLRIERDTENTGQLSLAEVDLGDSVRRPLRLPELDEGWGTPDAVVLRTLIDSRTGCVRVEAATRCMVGRDVPSEEPHGFDRILTLPEQTTYDATLTARPEDGPGLMRLIQSRQALQANGSSQGVPDPRASGLAAVDGDPGTAWTADRNDFAPTLALNWLGKRLITGLTISVDPDAPVRRPTSLTLTYPGGKQTVQLDEKGEASSFKPFRSDRLSVRIDGTSNDASIDENGVQVTIPPGISELSLDGLVLAPVAISDQRRTWRCGTGPDLVVNGDVHQTSLVASARELYTQAEVEVAWCEDEDAQVTLSAGENNVRAMPSEVAIAGALVLGGEELASSASTTASVTTDGAAGATVSAQGGAEWLVQHQNFNAGWTGSNDGAAVDSIVVDGWQQGWHAKGEDSVRTSFAPDRPYRWALFGGGLLLVLLAGLALVPRRRWPGADLPAVGPLHLPATLLLLLAPLMGGVLAGWPGAVIGVVGAAVGAVVRRWPEVSAWLIGGLVLVASGGYYLRPWGDGDGWAGTWSWPHYLVVAALCLALGFVAEPRPTSRNRMKGNSTAR